MVKKNLQLVLLNIASSDCVTQNKQLHSPIDPKFVFLMLQEHRYKPQDPQIPQTPSGQLENSLSLPLGSPTNIPNLPRKR